MVDNGPTDEGAHKKVFEVVATKMAAKLAVAHQSSTGGIAVAHGSIEAIDHNLESGDR